MVSMQLQGNLSGNKEQEVGLDVGHRLLHHGLLGMRSPVVRVSAIGRVNGCAPFLFSQTGEEIPHLGPEEHVQRVKHVCSIPQKSLVWFELFYL